MSKSREGHVVMVVKGHLPNEKDLMVVGPRLPEACRGITAEFIALISRASDYDLDSVHILRECLSAATVGGDLPQNSRFITLEQLLRQGLGLAHHLRGQSIGWRS